MKTNRREPLQNGDAKRPAIARYFDAAQIARFQMELSMICRERRANSLPLTARDINEQAAAILAKARSQAEDVREAQDTRSPVSARCSRR